MIEIIMWQKYAILYYDEFNILFQRKQELV